MLKDLINTRPTQISKQAEVDKNGLRAITGTTTSNNPGQHSKQSNVDTKRTEIAECMGSKTR